MQIRDIGHRCVLVLIFPMPMSKRNEFKTELEKIVKIFFLCKESYLVLRELYKTIDNSKYIIDLKYRGSFFTLTKVNYWRVIVLQLSKLYIERERFNIIKLLEKCKTGNYYASLNINQDFIIQELNRIEEKQKSINNIKSQRDKIFAHEDANIEEIVNDITLDETKKLIELCQNIIFHIYSEVFDTHYEFEMANSAIGNLKNVLKSLDEKEKQREEEEAKFLKEFIRKANQNK